MRQKSAAASAEMYCRPYIFTVFRMPLLRQRHPVILVTYMAKNHLLRLIILVMLLAFGVLFVPSHSSPAKINQILLASCQNDDPYVSEMDPYGFSLRASS